MRVACAALMVAACGGEPEESFRPLDVMLECASLHGDTCLVENEVRLWLQGDAPVVTIDGQAIDAPGTRVAGGLRLVIEPPNDASRLEIRRGDARRRIELQRVASIALLEEIGAERTPESRARVEQALASAEGSERAALTSRAGRIALSLGDDEAAALHLRTSRDLHRALGETSEAVLDAVALAWVLQRRQWRFEQALEALDEVADLYDTVPIPAARARHRRGVVLVELGRLREAERELRLAGETARKIGVAQLVAQSAIVRAETLHRLGRPQAAAEALAVEGELDACMRGDHATTRAWLELLDAELGEPIASTELFERAEQIYAACDANADQRANAALNHALAHLVRGELANAREALERSEELSAGAMVRAWQLEWRGRHALARGDFSEALTTYEELGRRAAIAGALGPAWRADLGRGRALEELGRRSAAREAYGAAERVLDREVGSLSLGSAPGFVGRRWQSAARLAALELARDPAEALSVLRRARLRALPTRRALPSTDYRRVRRTLDADAGSAWTLPLDELEALERSREEDLEALHRSIDEAYATFDARPRPRAEGELLVVVFPHEDGRLVLLASDEGVQGERVADDAWPSFVEGRLSARPVRVVGAGTHSFTRPPVDAPVVHSLDLARPSSTARDGRLVVVDPTGNLDAARDEGQRVRERRSARLLSGESADLDSVSGALAQVDFFHYAGHAIAGEALTGALRLYDVPLTAADVLAMQTVPRRVVLNGCESATATGLVPIGVAQALIVSGSEQVLAAVGPVDDREAAQLTDRLLSSNETLEAWADVLRSDAPHPFRVFVP